MAGLFVIGDATFNSLATGSILVVAIAVLGSITVLPALLVKLGRWVDRPRVPLLWRLNRRIGRGGISSRILAPVVRHPLVALVVSGSSCCCWRCRRSGMRIHSGNLQTLPDVDPGGADLHADHAGVPRRGHDGHRGGQGARRGPCRGRSCAPGAATGTRSPPTDFVGLGPGPGRGLGGRHHLGAPPRDAVRRVGPEGGPRRSSRCATTSHRQHWTTSTRSTPSGGGAGRVARLRRTGSTTGCRS